MHILAPLCLAAAATASVLQKRCSPAWNPDWHGNFYRIPCWLSLHANCTQYLPPSSTLVVDAERRSAVVLPLSGSCAELIAIEHEREADGRKPWGWSASEGTMDTSHGVLLLTNMSDRAVARYERYASGLWA